MTLRTCESCSQPLVRRASENQEKWAARRFCCRNCYNLNLAKKTDAAYLNYHVNDATGCWEWQGYADSNGYGRLYDRTRVKKRRTDWAHRAFYERFTGAIPPGYEIDHECQNTICVRPDHLAAVTKVEHARRTFERLGLDDRHRLAAELRSTGLSYQDVAEALAYSGRSAASNAVKRAITKGLVDPSALPEQPRLTDAERDDIRDLYAVGVPQPDLAAWYGVDSGHISRICSRLDTRAARRAARQQAHMSGDVS